MYRGTEASRNRNVDIKRLHDDGISIKELARRFGLTKQRISKIIHSKNLPHGRPPKATPADM